jgi:acyl phosphate:glycerol-3-phosphate acyltransferase
MLSILLIVIISYLAGSIPTAVIASRILMKDDIRNHGSKNAGATNVFRVMGWKPALAVVLIDVGKGVLATLLVSKLRIDPVALDPLLLKVIAGTASIIGHVWTVFAGFKGGKGVGTAFGVFLGIAPIPVLITLGVWLIVVFTTRIVSVSSLAAAVCLPVSLWIQKRFFKPETPAVLLWITIGLAALIFFTHRSNIKRLLRGEEHRFGSKKEKREKT